MRKSAGKRRSAGGVGQTAGDPETDADRNRRKKIEEKRRELPNQAQIEMEVILQKPELPTGCESVALTMVLKQKGYPIEKTTIAEEYLIYNRDNYASGYVGDPSTYGGVGVYPPGLVNTANCF